MKEIIRPIDSEVLEEFGFSFDGYYWVSPNIPFKLIKSGEEGSYMVHIEDAAIGQTPPPVKSNSNLLQLMCQFSMYYLQARMQEFKPATAEQAQFAVQQFVNDYFRFGISKLRMVVVPGPQGIGLMPGNEYTFTILNGIQCEFKVTFEDGETEVMYCHPECMCTRYLKELFDKTVVKVEVRGEEDFEPYFGLGIQIAPMPTNRLVS